MKISSKNEYGKLISCIVGDATGAQFPKHDGIFAYNKDTSSWTETELQLGKFPQHVIDESNEDLETLANTLKSAGVTVYRPGDLDHSQVIQSRYWETDGMYNYCPRDVMLVVDDMVIETPMTYRARQFETDAYRKIRNQAIASGARWCAAPRPRLSDTDVFVKDGHTVLTEDEPIFDAANVLRHNDDLIYLVSNSGNRIGGEWLQNMLGQKYHVHIADNLYSHAHIDSTISVLRDGLVVLNGARINENNCPALFKGWTKIYVQDVVPQSFYHWPYASKWIAVNMFSIDPKTVIVDKHQHELIKQLEQLGQTVVPLELRHSRTLGGGFHCVTLDLERAN